MNLTRSLKERKLVQWALAYLAGAWLVLEVFSTLQQGLDWPPRLFLFVLAGLAAGFLFTLVLAWYHGEQGRQKVSGAELVIIAGLLLVASLLVPLLSGGASDDPPSSRPATSEGLAADEAASTETSIQRPSIAVLPFNNLSNRKEDEFFVHGIHEEVRAQLGKIRSLDVKSLTSVLGYQDAPANLRTVGQELGAEYVVEGGVQRAGGTVRITVALYDANSDERVWGQSYDDDLTLTNVLEVQRDIALQVATRLGAEILPAERGRLDVDPPSTLQAYELYLDGLSYLRQVSMGAGTQADRRFAQRRAVEIFEAAIEADPDWAPSRAALGAVLHWMASGSVETETNYARAQAVLEEALQVDSQYGPAWAGLAFVRSNWNPDLAEAEDAYLRAEVLGSPAYSGYALLLTGWGRFEEAHAAFDRAVAHDPLSMVTRVNRGWAFWCAGDYGRAATELEAARALTENFHSWIDFHLSQSYLHDGAVEQGLEALERFRRSGEGSAAQLALLYAMVDSVRVAENYLRESEVDGSPTQVAGVATALLLDQPDRAIEILRKAASGSPSGEGYVGDVVCYDLSSIAQDDSYRQMLDLVGIPEAAS